MQQTGCPCCGHVIEALPDDVAQALADWGDPDVQRVYEIFCDGEQPPDQMHWEGFAARRIVAALRSSTR